jgi:hypothetical protein
VKRCHPTHSIRTKRKAELRCEAPKFADSAVPLHTNTSAHTNTLFYLQRSESEKAVGSAANDCFQAIAEFIFCNFTAPSFWKQTNECLGRGEAEDQVRVECSFTSTYSSVPSDEASEHFQAVAESIFCNSGTSGTSRVSSIRNINIPFNGTRRKRGMLRSGAEKYSER